VPEVGEEALLVDDPLSLQRQPVQVCEAQRRHQQIPPPAREGISRGEGDARGCDRRHVVVDRLLEAVPVGADADLPSPVLLPVRDDRPAVVAPGAQDVDLVAALGTVLGFPHLAGLGVQSQSLRVAVTPGEDLGTRPGATDEGIVLRDRPVRTDAQHLTEVAAEILGEVALLALSDRDVEQAAPVEGQGSPEMVDSRASRLRGEEDFEILESIAAQLRACDARGVGVRRHGDRVAEIDPSVLAEGGIALDAEQASLSDERHLGNPGHRMDLPGGEVDPRQPAGLLRHEHFAGAHERHVPGKLEAIDDRDQPEVLRLGSIGNRPVGDLQVVVGRQVQAQRLPLQRLAARQCQGEAREKRAHPRRTCRHGRSSRLELKRT